VLDLYAYGPIPSGGRVLRERSGANSSARSVPHPGATGQARDVTITSNRVMVTATLRSPDVLVPWRKSKSLSGERQNITAQCMRDLVDFGLAAQRDIKSPCEFYSSIRIDRATVDILSRCRYIRVVQETNLSTHPPAPVQRPPT